MIYSGVLQTGGANICVWRPRSVVLPVEQSDHFDYVWGALGALNILKLTGVTLQRGARA